MSFELYRFDTLVVFVGLICFAYYNLLFGAILMICGVVLSITYKWHECENLDDEDIDCWLNDVSDNAIFDVSGDGGE